MPSCHAVFYDGNGVARAPQRHGNGLSDRKYRARSRQNRALRRNIRNFLRRGRQEISIYDKRGQKPTFDDQSVSVETYIFDFDGDLYGKTVTIYFVERTRDVQKFESVDALKNQLVRDEAAIPRNTERLRRYQYQVKYELRQSNFRPVGAR